MHTHPIRVYYEDTDLAGIVYYANYLKFIERARTEALRAFDVDQMALRDELGVVFAVRRVEADYIFPARMDDQLLVETKTTQIKGASVVLSQVITRDGQPIFDAKVTIVALSPSGKPARIPAQVREALAKLSPPRA